MTIQHKNITEADLHEPKGVSLATADTLYVADGAGSGTWEKIAPTSLAGVTTNGVAGQFVGLDGTGNFQLASAPHGHISFYNLGTPGVITYPSTATKVSVVTVGSGVSGLISEGTNSRLTYTGTDSVVLNISYVISLDQTSGSNRDILVGLYKNGVLLDAQSVSTTQTGLKTTLTGGINDLAATNDYYETYVTNLGGSGDVNVYAFQMTTIIAGA